MRICFIRVLITICVFTALIYSSTKFNVMSTSAVKILNNVIRYHRATILIHWFMQKSRPLENESVVSDRRTAYLWRFCNGTSTRNYKVSERYHILWGQSILASVCFCFYHCRDELFTAEIYLCILAVQWDGGK